MANRVYTRSGVTFEPAEVYRGMQLRETTRSSMAGKALVMPSSRGRRIRNTKYGASLWGKKVFYLSSTVQ